MKIAEIIQLINESVDSEVKALQATHNIGYGAAGYGSIGIDNLKKIMNDRAELISKLCKEHKEE
jgi:hypothetical protein